ncbi:abortive infection family protein [Kitasatospora purpeofusca]|uniref:abortive infection family protein n=1 Tax=Kitasatospora purpeofusca TaxID=67352 RepID=UPI003F4AB3E9
MASSKELLESLCKVILGRSGVEYTNSDELPVLYRKVAELLSLKAESVPDSAKGSESAQKILRTLVTTVQTLGELRNQLGWATAVPRPVPPSPGTPGSPSTVPWRSPSSSSTPGRNESTEDFSPWTTTSPPTADRSRTGQVLGLPAWRWAQRSGAAASVGLPCRDRGSR